MKALFQKEWYIMRPKVIIFIIAILAAPCAVFYMIQEKGNAVGYVPAGLCMFPTFAAYYALYISMESERKSNSLEKAYSVFGPQKVLASKILFMWVISLISSVVFIIEYSIATNFLNYLPMTILLDNWAVFLFQATVGTFGTVWLMTVFIMCFNTEGIAFAAVFIPMALGIMQSVYWQLLAVVMLLAIVLQLYFAKRTNTGKLI